MPLYEYGPCRDGHISMIHHIAADGPPPEVTRCCVPDCRCSTKRRWTVPMVPLMGWDAKNRRRRRRNPADTGVADLSKARRRL